MKIAVRTVLRFLLRTSAKPLKLEHLEGPILVIAPHADDETLGCGGTMAMAVKNGVPVRVVVVTDGSASAISAVMDKRKLAALRCNESERACSALDVSPSNLTFLGFADGQAKDNLEAIAASLEEIIRWASPAYIFAPCIMDEHRDHRAVAMALDVLRKKGTISVPVFGYVIWTRSRRFFREILASGAFLRLRRVHVAPVLAMKEKALGEYKSQIASPATGGALSSAFLRSFLAADELFFELP